MNKDELHKKIADRFKTEAIVIPDSVPDDQMEGWLKGFHEGAEWSYKIIEQIFSS